MAHARDRARELGRHVLRCERPRAIRAGQRAQVSALRLAELERAGERVDRGGRRRRRPALLEPDVPVDADAGECGHLLAAQPGRAPAQPRQPERRGLEPLAA